MQSYEALICNELTRVREQSYLFKNMQDSVSLEYRRSICQDYFEILNIFVFVQFNSP